MTSTWRIVMTRGMGHADYKLVEYCVEKACNTVMRSVMEHSDAKDVENGDDREHGAL